MSVDINPPPNPGRRPVGIMTNFDGNFSTNYAGEKNGREIDHIHYGDCDEPCPMCHPV